jgi:nucleoside 2-deoxyribosyltransferase
MLAVVGGCYLESCREPHWSQLYGSGLRAAAALAQLNKSVTLLTYCDTNNLEILEAVTKTFDLQYKHEPRLQSIRFSYHHPLSVPNISPLPSAINRPADLQLSSDNILRFGFIEGQAVVRADRAVYDPQSPNNPQQFKDNGSKAEHLAIVANSREARLMTGKEELNEVGQTLLATQKAEVVVLKCGPLGCIVFTSREPKRIPVFKTDYVWSIGSGDVFAAVFAHFWGDCKMDPGEAAYLSSLHTALYCNSQSLPLPANLSGFDPPAIMLDAVGLRSTQVYLAGPFFSIAERWLIEETRGALMGQGLKVFSPLHDVGPGPASKVAPADVKGIEESTAVLALLDGLDAGTIFEVGYARKKGLPVVILAQNVGSEDLKMFTGTGCEVVDDFATAIYKTVWSIKN